MSTRPSMISLILGSPDTSSVAPSSRYVGSLDTSFASSSFFKIDVSMAVFVQGPSVAMAAVDDSRWLSRLLMTRRPDDLLALWH